MYLSPPQFLSPSIETAARESDLLGSCKFMVFEFSSFADLHLERGEISSDCRQKHLKTKTCYAVILCRQSVGDHTDSTQVFLTLLSLSILQHTDLASGVLCWKYTQRYHTDEVTRVLTTSSVS